jgi:uncharacterized protein (TIGR02300 family)
MANPEWGIKRVCPTTGKRFYDLNRTPVISPYTGEVVDIEQLRRKSAGMAPVPEPKAAKLVDDDIDDDSLIEVADSDDADIDDELLEDDGDDTVSLDELADVSGEDEEP